MLQQTEAPLGELLKATVALDERAKLVMLGREVKAFDAKIRGLRRTRMPDAESWLACAKGIADLAEKAPASLRPALAKTGTYCLERARELAQQPKTLEQRCARLVYCRTKGIAPDARFAIALKSVGEDGHRRLAGRASSTQVDRDGDEFSIGLLRRMSKDILQVPVFADHTWRINDVVGKVIGSRLTERGQFTDLDVQIELLPEGDVGADKAWGLVQAAVPIGLSVGLLVYERVPRQGDRRGDLFKDGEVVDLSIVGIPSQRRSTGLTPIKSRARKGSAAQALIQLKAWRTSPTK